MKKSIFAFASVLAMLFLAGCAEQVRAQDRLDAGPNNTFNVSKYLAPNFSSNRELSGPTPCTCMFCANRSTFVFNPFSGFIDTTLAYGNCSFAACNSSLFQEILEEDTPDIYPRQFMLGAGPNTGEYSLAQRYCNGSLTMPVIWAVGNATNPPKPLSRPTALCYLTRNQLPVVVFYNNNPDQPMPIEAWINASISYDENRGRGEPIGPVIITTEAMFNSSDTRPGGAVERVQKEIDAIRDNCPRCLVALAPADLDYAGVEMFLDNTTPIGKKYASKIDLVGMGFIANDNEYDGKCLLAKDAVGERFLFSRDVALRRFHKPSVWYAAGIAEGKTAIPNCKWDSVQVRNAYQFMVEEIPAFAESGIIGVAPYRFLDSNNSLPIPCNPEKHSCNFGMRGMDGTQKDQIFYGWFSSCQFYTTNTIVGRSVPVPKGSPQQAIAFSTNGYGMVCIMQEMTKTVLLKQILVGAQEKTPPIPEPDPELQKRVSALSCGGCIAEASMPRGFCFYRAPNFPQASCSKYSEFGIDEEAQKQSFDPTFMRALYQHESSFDNCAQSEANDTSPCGAAKVCQVNELYATKFDVPANQQYCPTGDVLSTCNAIFAKPNKQVCALGLAQCIENPGDDPTPDNLCGGSNYNPFNPRDSACCGTYKFSTAFEKKMEDLQDELSNPNLRRMINPGEEGWYAAWLATTSYYGDGPTLQMMINYANSPGATADGMVQAIYNGPLAGRSDWTRNYGMRVITLYNDALQKCGGGCQFRDCSQIATYP